MSTTDLAALTAELKAKGVRALTVTWCDANGIQRSRSAPIDKLASAVHRGMGCSFAGSCRGGNLLRFPASNVACFVWRAMRHLPR